MSTHWSRLTHICVSKLTIISSNNNLWPDWRQVNMWANAGSLSIKNLGTNFSEIRSEIDIFSFTKMHLKMSSAKWRLYCVGLNVLNRRSEFRDHHCGNTGNATSSKSANYACIFATNTGNITISYSTRTFLSSYFDKNDHESWNEITAFLARLLTWLNEYTSCSPYTVKPVYKRPPNGILLCLLELI